MKAARVIFLLTLAFSISNTALAQRDVEDGDDWKERLYFGGGGGFNGGNSNGIRYWSISVTPIVGYMVAPKFSVGTGVSYQRTTYQDYNFNYVQYGFMPFLRYNFNELFLTAEYNYINLPTLTQNSSGFGTDSRVFRSRMLFGAGYSQPLGGRSRLNAVALYDVLYKPGNGFLSPWVFRVFFSF
jgi:hypothetical protein